MRNLILSLLIALFALPLAGFCQENAEEAKEPEKVLYIFAHQDDEIPILVKMALDVRGGRDVHVIWITDGAVTAPPSIREKESRGVMEMIGVPQKNLDFLGHPDQYSYKHLYMAFRDVMEIAEKHHFAEITNNAYEGGNIDHDVASLMGSLAAERLEPKPTNYEFPLYNAYKNNYRVAKFIPRDDTEILYVKLDKELAELMISSLDMYPSQAEIIKMLKVFVNKKNLKRKGITYRISPKYDYTKPPTDGTLGYELNSRSPVTFEDWLKEVKPFLERLEKEN
ncbi:MAG: PIG-L family deacetylase [bacterium]